MAKTDCTFLSMLGLRRANNDPKSKEKTFLKKDFKKDLSDSVRRLEKVAGARKNKHNENILAERTRKNNWDFYDLDSRYELLHDFRISYNVDWEIASYIIDDVKKVKDAAAEGYDNLCNGEMKKLEKIVETCNSIINDPVRRRVARDIASLKCTIVVTKELEILIPEFSDLSGSAKGHKLKLQELESNPEFNTLSKDYLILIAKVLAIAENNRNETNSKFITIEIWNDEFRNNPTINKILAQFKESKKV